LVVAAVVVDTTVLITVEPAVQVVRFLQVNLMLLLVRFLQLQWVTAVLVIQVVAMVVLVVQQVL
jgi:hypothetical protein